MIIDQQVFKYFIFLPALQGVCLTRREADIICLLEEYTYERIANYLDMSMRTVEFYVSNIKHKLGCVDRLELTELIKGQGVVHYLRRRYPIFDNC